MASKIGKKWNKEIKLNMSFGDDAPASAGDFLSFGANSIPLARLDFWRARISRENAGKIGKGRHKGALAEILRNHTE